MTLKKENEIVAFSFKIDRKLWNDFGACLRKKFYKEGITKDKGIVYLIKKFVEENYGDGK